MMQMNRIKFTCGEMGTLCRFEFFLLKITAVAVVPISAHADETQSCPSDG